MKVTTVLLVALVLASTPAFAQPREGRLETGLFFTHVFLEKVGSTDHRPGSSTAGLGGRVGWRLLPHLDIEGELAVHPDAGVRGHRVQGFLGVKSGVRFKNVGLFAKVRPGFLYFSQDPFGVSEPDSTPFNSRWADSMDPALDVGAVVEYHMANGLFVRFDLAETIVRYHARSVISSQLEPPRPIAAFTARNRQWSLGIGKRF